MLCNINHLSLHTDNRNPCKFNNTNQHRRHRQHMNIIKMYTLNLNIINVYTLNLNIINVCTLNLNGFKINTLRMNNILRNILHVIIMSGDYLYASVYNPHIPQPWDERKQRDRSSQAYGQYQHNAPSFHKN